MGQKYTWTKPVRETPHLPPFRIHYPTPITHLPPLPIGRGCSRLRIVRRAFSSWSAPLPHVWPYDVSDRSEATKTMLYYRESYVVFAHIYVYNIAMPNKENIDRVFELAASQWGLFTAAQALAEGASRTQISRLVESGRIEPASYGVYRMAGGEETPHAPIKAAWLSLFPNRAAYDRLRARPRDAIVAGRTAACMHGDTGFYEAPYTFDVAAGKRTARGDVALRPWPVEERDVALIEGLPVTSVEKTVADLVRGREDPSLVGGFVAGACSRGHVVDEARLAELLAPLAARNGFAKGDGKAFARKLIADYAAEAQVRFAIEVVSRILNGPDAGPETRERFRAAVDTLVQTG